MFKVFFNKQKLLYSDKGFLLCLALSLVVLIVFFGDLLMSPNTIFFGTSSDAMLVYYNSLFHTLHNKELLSEMSMFYPYSESIFFTSCMPILTQLIKLFCLQSYTIGIINLFMLLSMPAGAMFLYLIFREYKVNLLFAVCGAIVITYLSPQISRLSGHYNLSYCFAIPMTIWLMIKFIKEPNYKKSFFIGLYCFFLATMHMYLFVFAVAIISFSWMSAFFTKSFVLSFKKYVINYFIQIIFPFLVLQLLIFIVNTSDARTNSPWGFFDYYSSLSGIFYTANSLYEPLLNALQLDETVSYEGTAFVGISALIFCIILIIKSIINLLILKPIKLFNPIGDKFLNFMLLMSLICLIFSFCIPFKLGYENLLNYLGFLRQFRALGRFTWPFFYVINICLIVCVSNIPDKHNKMYFKPLLMLLIVGFMGYDAFSNIDGLQDKLNHTNAEWSDTKNVLKENDWVQRIDPNKYQAILPFPYFQVGSENLGTTVEEQSVSTACLVSIKTGLPMISVLGSRLPIERAYNNLQLLMEPTGKSPSILNDFKNDKSILIVSINYLTNDFEKEIISYSTLINNCSSFSLYEISLSDLKKYYLNHSKQQYSQYLNKKLYNFNGYQTTDSIKNFVAKNYSDINKHPGCFDNGVIKGKGEDYTTIIETPLPVSIDSSYTVGFWVKNLKQDLVSRANFEISAKTKNSEVYSILYSYISNHYHQLDNDWTLIEHTFKVRSCSDTLKINLWNHSIPDKELIIDNVLLRASNTNVYLNKNEYLLMNNRVFYKQ